MSKGMEVRDAIRVALRKHPHFRVGQLIVNAVTDRPRLYYMEDEELAENILAYIDTLGSPRG